MNPMSLLARVLIAGLVFFCVAGATARAEAVSLADRAAVVEAVRAHLRTDYADATVGLKADAALEDTVDADWLAAPPTGEAFAATLTALLQSLTGDGHLNVEYAAEGVSEDAASYSEAEMERWYGAHLNYGVERIERLAGNVGLLDLRVFAPIPMGGETVSAAMNVVAPMAALVIDLRNNGGGIGEMANLVASYLFGPEPQPLTGIYNRPRDTLTREFTKSDVPGPRFGPDKPVYVLISKETFSAAEALAYDLQALKRAVVVGEVSGGGAHPFEYVGIHPNFVLWSVTARSINPITGTNWQGVGVRPDIAVAADQALEAALRHLRAQRPSAQDNNG